VTSGTGKLKRNMDRLAGQALTLDGVTHAYGTSKAVDNVTLDIRGGELVALLGPSGCGKTTLLRIIAGFINQTEGRVIIGGTAIDHLPPHKRTIGIVFQNYALFPHMTVEENIAYGLAARGVSRSGQMARVGEMLDLVKLSEMRGRFPRQLSGGQQQRIALARALAVRPSILLLDEPFAALDKNLRLDMQIEIRRIQRMAGTTTIIVTHDQEEALSMADRVAVLNQGRLEQFAPATDVYDKPGSFFVNTFVGASNVMQGVLADVSGERGVVRFADGSTLPGVLAGVLAHGGQAGDRVQICVRPEHLAISDAADALRGEVEMGLPLGPSVVHEIRLAAGHAVKIATSRESGAAALPPGMLVAVKPTTPDAARIYPFA
jgi:putative spermidine/putrescine transport system ATP-binding protein